MTTMPRCVAAATSILSTPMPARRRVSMPGDVVGHTFFFKQPDESLDELGLALARQGGETGVGKGETDRGAGADALVHSEEADPRRLHDPGGDDRGIVLAAAD